MNSSLPVVSVIRNCRRLIVISSIITNSLPYSASNAKHTPFRRNGYAIAANLGTYVRFTHLWGIGVGMSAGKGKLLARQLSGAFRMPMPYPVTLITLSLCDVSRSSVLIAPLTLSPSRREPYRRWWNECKRGSRATSQHLPLLRMLPRRVALSPSARLTMGPLLAKVGEG